MSAYLRLLAEIDESEIIQVLSENSGDDYVNVVRFVKSLDGYIADWDLTRKLRDYFVSEMAEHDAEG